MIQVPQGTSRVVMLKLFETGTTTPATGKTVAIVVSKNGGAFANPNAGATNATEVSVGWYKVTLDATDTGTLGDLVVRGTAAACDATERLFGVVSAATGGLTNLDAAVSSRMATFTLPTNFSALAVTAGGAVTAGTVSDKTGYSLTQAFPTNFSALAVTAAGKVTVGTNDDKTGYALTQSFPSNFSSLAITGGGAVTAGTVSDKTGYALSAAGVDAIWDEAQSGHATAGTFGAYLDSSVSGVSTGGVSAADIADAVWDEARTGHAVSGTFGETVTSVHSRLPASGTLSTHAAADVWAVGTRTITGGTVTTVSDKTGYSLTQSFPANFAALAVTGAGVVSADVKKVNAVTLVGDGSTVPWGPS